MEAAAGLSAHILKWDYQDFERPVYYELVNEPLVVLAGFEFSKMASSHLGEGKKFERQECPGGWTLSSGQAYYYKEQYKKFKVNPFIH